MKVEREFNHAEKQASQVYNQYVSWSVRLSNTYNGACNFDVFPTQLLKNTADITSA